MGPVLICSCPVEVSVGAVVISGGPGVVSLGPVVISRGVVVVAFIVAGTAVETRIIRILSSGRLLNSTIAKDTTFLPFVFTKHIISFYNI